MAFLMVVRYRCLETISQIDEFEKLWRREYRSPKEPWTMEDLRRSRRIVRDESTEKWTEFLTNGLLPGLEGFFANLCRGLDAAIPGE